MSHTKDQPRNEAESAGSEPGATELHNPGPQGPETMEARAAALLDRTRAALDAPMLTKMTVLPAMLEEFGQFALDLARRVDHLTPYLDEGES